MSKGNSQKRQQRVLLIGDINQAFLDPAAVYSFEWDVRTNVPDAIDTAGKGHYDAIAVVMAGLSARLTSVLKALRTACGTTRIVLLARMYEEPLAAELVNTSLNGSAGEKISAAAATDYLICPLQADRFYAFVTGRGDIGGAALKSVIDETASKRIEELERLATTDELTGLKNRRYIRQFSYQIIEYARRENWRVSLLIFDIDDFKHYNDVYGHSAGDEILKQAAILMQRCCRAHDVVGRIGGDEFAVVFWDGPAKEAAAQKTERRFLAEHPREPVFIARRLQKELEKAELNLLGPAGKGVLTISGGLAGFPRDASTVEELFRLADKALLVAKRSGKNRIYLVGKPENEISAI